MFLSILRSSRFLKQNGLANFQSPAVDRRPCYSVVACILFLLPVAPRIDVYHRPYSVIMRMSLMYTRSIDWFSKVALAASEQMVKQHGHSSAHLS